MLCHLCNSWFRIIAECPYRIQATAIMFEDEHVHAQSDPETSTRLPKEEAEFDESTADDHTSTFFVQIVQQQSQHAFTG
eukprot:IDg21668t1